jgi:hypothetical protein
VAIQRIIVSIDGQEQLGQVTAGPVVELHDKNGMPVLAVRLQFASADTKAAVLTALESRQKVTCTMPDGVDQDLTYPVRTRQRKGRTVGAVAVLARYDRTTITKEA